MVFTVKSIMKRVVVGTEEVVVVLFLAQVSIADLVALGSRCVWSLVEDWDKAVHMGDKEICELELELVW